MYYIKRYFLIIIIAVLILLNLIPTPYFLVIPGQAINLSENITVENGEKDAKGQFLLTSTAIIKARIKEFRILSLKHPIYAILQKIMATYPDKLLNFCHIIRK